MDTIASSPVAHETEPLDANEELALQLVRALGTERTVRRLLADLADTEAKCPQCGCGMDTGIAYPACSDAAVAPHDRNWVHDTFCTNFALDICTTCDPKENS